MINVYKLQNKDAMFTFFEVGGKVRDELIGLNSKDIDYVVVPDMEYVRMKLLDKGIDTVYRMLIAYLEIEGYTIFLQTPKMFTVRAKFPIGHKYEGITADFVLARKEVGYKEGTREPIVVPGSLFDDLQRRDFTVNAIAKSENGDIIDFYDGVRDLKEKILRTPISGNITFDDDPLRLLRAIRFHITKGFKIDEPIKDYITNFDYRNKFQVVSEERIREELYKCFHHDTLLTLKVLNNFSNLRDYIFTETYLWLKPTNEQ